MDDNEKLDYLPSEIINCLSGEKVYPIFDKEKILSENKKKVNRKETSKESKVGKVPKHIDITSIRGDVVDKLYTVEKRPPTESVIPKKYYLVKDDLKRFIEYTNRELENLDDSDQRQTIFPTEYPQSRHEVKCLEETMLRMLDDVERPDFRFSNLVIQSRDDIKNLIEYVVQQEGVYNVILHELGRQVMTSTFEGGCTIMELRKKYSDLVNKIPDELMRLKEEVKEQVVKDSRLLFQIEEFQAAIIYLTDHLKEVKDQDVKVTKNALSLQSELEHAMQDSARSKELLNEYHVLYDLQKQRLDKQISSISVEKEEWSTLAFALSLKISDESQLNTTKRLRLLSKKLVQLSQHFAIFISDCDTVITTKIQDIADKYLKAVTKAHLETSKLVNNFHDLFHFLKTKFESFNRKDIVESTNQSDNVLGQIMSLNAFLGDEVVKTFMSEISSQNVANYREDMASMNVLIDEFKGLVNELSDRCGFDIDKSNEGANVAEFSKIYAAIDRWTETISSKLFHISNFQDFFLDFQSKVNKIESEIRSLKTQDSDNNTVGQGTDIDNILVLIDELFWETFESDQFGGLEKNEDFTTFTLFHNGLQVSMTNFIIQIDGFDAGIMENISKYQESITQWIVGILFLITTMTESNDLERQYQKLRASFTDLLSLSGSLYDYITRCAVKFVESSFFDSSSRQLEMEEYRVANAQWHEVAEILIRDIGDRIEQELIKRRRLSEKPNPEINMDNIEELIDNIAAKSPDNNIYLSIKSVRNIKDEVGEAEKRIRLAKKDREDLLLSLEEAKDKIREFESKIEELTMEYKEYTKL